MNVGWAYLGLAAIAVIVGAYMGMIQDRLLGDLVMLVSLPLIYIGSTNLAAANMGEKLTERAFGSTDPPEESDEP